MSTWHDVINTSPADGQLVWLRRAPEDTPPIAACWDALEARFLCGPDQWVMAWNRATRWRPLDAQPAWPYPRNGSTPWQDVYGYPPAQGQSVWVRRYPEDTAAFRAVFDRAHFVFILPTGWQLPWYDAWKWRAG